MTTPPFAITMWDFSWLERRWPGAGYEDWDRALDELVERGYTAVRIDAYPHLISTDPDRTWLLHPQWNQQSWGAPADVEVRPLPALIEFIEAAHTRGVRVALSTWFRQDAADTRMTVTTPGRLAEIWTTTLDHLDRAGLLSALLYVDLCNEFPHPFWAPFLYGTSAAGMGHDRGHPEVIRWMSESVHAVTSAYPSIPVTISMTMQWDRWRHHDVSALDFLEPHVWMASTPTSDFYGRVGYGFQQFDSAGYENLVRHGERTYRADADHFNACLRNEIDNVAEWSRHTGRGLVTTEGWSIVDYKDWPGLDWGWVTEVNELAVTHAAATGRWLGMCTSNFCGPQFVGMWRQVEWHQRMTAVIRSMSTDVTLMSR